MDAADIPELDPRGRPERQIRYVKLARHITERDTAVLE